MDLKQCSVHKPLIISHRGYNSIFPQNTMQSIQAALYKSDMVQIDILLTKDQKVVIFHDRYLSQLTNVAKFPQYLQRKREAAYDSQVKQEGDWWVIDFNLQELQKLRVQQYFRERPQFQNLIFKIVSLEQAFQEIIKIKKNRLPDNKCGLLIQIKSLWEFKEDKIDSILVEKLIQLLKKYELDTSQGCQKQNFPIVLQSFSHTILKLIQKSQLSLPVIHLFDEHQKIDQKFLENKRIKHMIGVGISQTHATQEMVELFNQNNLLVYYWVLRDDQPKKVPFKLKTYKEAYFYLLKIGINGFITQFPQKCQEYINEYYLNNQNQLQQ